MELLRLAVHKTSNQIEVSADLCAGWRKLEKWWGFEESCSQPFGDDVFRSAVRMVLWSRSPDLCRDAIKTFRYPADDRTEAIKVRNGQMRILLPLHDGWATSRHGHPVIRLDRELPFLRHFPTKNGKTIPATLPLSN